MKTIFNHKTAYLNKSIPLSCLLLIILSFGCKEKTNNVTITISNQVIGQIPEEIFGQFLEKPSWGGELGPEAALIPNSHTLQPGAMQILEEMNIPLLRFPGGSDVDYMNWTWMIDTPDKQYIKTNQSDDSQTVSSTKNIRPLIVGHKGDTVGANFGYDEAGQLAEKLGANLMLVVNFGDAYHERKPLRQAAMHEAGLLAYCAAPLGADLPSDLEKWPKLRAENGHLEPYPVKYVQIANEPFWLDRGVLNIFGEIDDEREKHFMQCAEAYINLFKKVLPEVKIILDGNCADLVDDYQDRFGEKVDLVAVHKYFPWAIEEFKKNGVFFPRDSLTIEDVWYGWVAVPNNDDTTGDSVYDGPMFRNALASRYPIALTEWNWNGWWRGKIKNINTMDSHFIKGFGVAGFMHAIMRGGAKGDIALATQSMTIGNSWGITSIRVSPEAEFEPYPMPTGQIVTFYNQNHGDILLETSVIPIHTYKQPFEINDIQPEQKVALLDVIATRNSEKLYVHIINRYYSEQKKVQVDLSAFEVRGKAIMKTFTGNINNEEPCSTEPLRYACIEEHEVELDSQKINFHLAAKSVAILEVPLITTQ